MRQHRERNGADAIGAWPRLCLDLTQIQRHRPNGDTPKSGLRKRATRPHTQRLDSVASGGCPNSVPSPAPPGAHCQSGTTKFVDAFVRGRLRSPKQTRRGAPMPATIQTGSHGSEVRALQRILVEMKLLDYEQIDGQFGPVTKGAVEGFQASAGLMVDGVVGPATWSALPPVPVTPLLRRGDHGGAVAALQQGLRTYGGAGAPTDPGAIDGDFGTHTEAAVRAYQTERGVVADGVVGDRTWWVPAGAAGATLASLAGRTTV